MFYFLYFVFWCLTGLKHLGTCDLSCLWLLAEPSDRNLVLEFFSLQNPTLLRVFGEKSWPFINKPWSKQSCTGWTKWPKCWPSRSKFLEFFSLQNPHTFCKKKFPVQFCVFWPTMKQDISVLSKVPICSICECGRIFLLIFTFYTQSTNSIIIDYPLIKIFKLLTFVNYKKQRLSIV